MKTGGRAGTFAALIIFCVFAVLALTVLTLGANAYRNAAALSGEGYGERVALSYIWTKVKNGDDAGKVFASGGTGIGAEKFHGLSALYIDETYDGVLYHTVIYHHEGRLCELFFEDGLEFLPEDGVPVVECAPLSFDVTPDGLIKASAGGSVLFVFPRGGSM